MRKAFMLLLIYLEKIVHSELKFIYFHDIFHPSDIFFNFDLIFEKDLRHMILTNDSYSVSFFNGDILNDTNIDNVFCARRSRQSYSIQFTPKIIFFRVAVGKNLFDILKTVHRIATLTSGKTKCRSPYIFIDARDENPIVLSNFMESYYSGSQSNAMFSFSSDIYIIFNFPKDNTAKLIEIYTIKRKTFANVIALKNDKINFENLISQKLKRRENFQGIPLTITAVNDTFYELESKFESLPGGGQRLVSGSAVNMLRFWEQSLNFNEEAIIGNWPDFNGDDDVKKNTTANQVSADKADISIVQLIVSPGRARKSQYLQPTYLIGLQAFFIQPKTRMRDIFLSRFEFPLWICFILTWILIITTLKLSIWASQRFCDPENDADADISKDTILWALGSSTQQGWYMSPNSTAAKIIFLIGSLTGFVCFTAFSSSIVSILSIRFIPIKTTKDLLASSLGMLVDLDVANFYKIYEASDSNSTTRSRSWESVDLLGGIKKIEDENNFLVTWPENFYVVGQSTGHCVQDSCSKFFQLSLSTTPVRSAMSIKKGSPLREILNYKIILMKELGINSRIMIGHFRNIGMSTTDKDIDEKFIHPLGVPDVFLAYTILFCGHLLSGVILILEKLHSQIVLRKILFK